MRLATPHPAQAAAPPPRAPTLGERLRHETRDLHDRIEANPRFGRLMAADLTRDEYRQLLLRLLGHHRPVEAALAAAASHLPRALGVLDRLRRTALLQADLRALDVEAGFVAALSTCPPPGLTTAEAAWGTLYVLEGATLGGQVIARHIAATLGIGPGNGAAALVPYGDQAGPQWRAFKAALEATAPDLDQDAVVDAARAAFTRLDDWMATPA